MSQPATDFDIVPVAPHVDLVLFDNVLSCYPCNKDLTATYTLGEAVQQSTWDWVGLFRTEWRFLGEYVSYRWASLLSSDVTSPRRRAVCFPSWMVETTDDLKTPFQLLYVSNGNHVVGVSPPFRFGPAEFENDLNISCLFRELKFSQPSTSDCHKHGRQKVKGQKRQRDEFELVDECAASAVPRKRPCCKQKITKVYRDTDTLVNIPTTDIADNLNIVRFYPSDKKLTKQPMKMKLFDVDWRNKIRIPKFPTAVLTVLDANANIIKTVDYHNRPSLTYTPITSADSTQRQPLDGYNNAERFEFGSETLNGSDDAERGNVTMVNRLNGTKTKTRRPLTPEFDNVCNWLMEQSYNTISRRYIHESLNGCETGAVAGTSIQQEACSQPTNDWLVWEPRKLMRLKKMLHRQKSTMDGLIQTVQDRDSEITNLKTKVRELQALLQVADNASEKFQRLSEELTTQIKDILSKRAKDHTNEWRQFVRQFQERTTQTTSSPSSSSSSHVSLRPGNSSSSGKGRPATRHGLRNKHMSKALATETQPRSKLHKGRAQAEQCPTCGLKFSVKADRHVIEEHIVFHDRAKKRN